MKHKFSQSHFPIQTQSQRNSEGPRPRRLTKSLQPSSQCPMGAYHPHKAPQDAGWCVYTWHTRQGPDRVCFSSSIGSNLRSTSYDHMPKKNRAHCVCKGPGSRSFISLWSFVTTMVLIPTNSGMRQIIKYTEQLLSSSHRSVYLLTDRFGLLVKPHEKVFIFG